MRGRSRTVKLDQSLRGNASSAGSPIRNGSGPAALGGPTRLETQAALLRRRRSAGQPCPDTMVPAGRRVTTLLRRPAGHRPHPPSRARRRAARPRHATMAAGPGDSSGRHAIAARTRAAICRNSGSVLGRIERDVERHGPVGSSVSGPSRYATKGIPSASLQTKEPRHASHRTDHLPEIAPDAYRATQRGRGLYPRLRPGEIADRVGQAARLPDQRLRLLHRHA